jgi:hypothetical protein
MKSLIREGETVTKEDARLICRDKLNLCIGPAMSEYIVKRVAAAEAEGLIPVIGGDARTGVPARREFPVALAKTELRT